MKKKMVCIALFSVLGFGASLLPALATPDEYGADEEEISQGTMEDDGLPADYEFELQETDQPFMTDESFPAEEEMEGNIIEEMEEEPLDMSGASHQEDQ